MTKPNFAVILSGAGVYDGSEIHEAVLTLLAIDRQGGTSQCFAPDTAQHDVINHLTGQPMAETRNALVEAARIARGRVKPLADFQPQSFDALILPGGFGAAKTLSSFATDGSECSVHPEVEQAIQAMARSGKPIGALCISPVLIVRVLGELEVTIGSDSSTASAIEEMGGSHRTTGHGDVVVDAAHKVVTSPCYMLDATLSQIADGADATVKALIEMMGT